MGNDDELSRALRILAEHPDLLRVAMAAAKAGPAPPATTQSSATFAELWEPYARERGPELSCFDSVHKTHAKHLLPFFGPLVWTECVPAKADEYVRMRRGQEVLRIKEDSKRRRVSITTIRHEVATLKAVLEWHRSRRRTIDRNPMERYCLPMVKSDMATVQDRNFFVNDQMFVAVLEKCPLILQRMLVLASQTGMRRDEFRCLPWREVDLDAGIISLPAERTKNREPRKIPLDDVALHVLRRQRRITEGYEYVFVNPRTMKDAPIPKSTMGQQFRRARDLAGVKGPADQAVWIHSIRRRTGTINAMRSMMPVRMQMDLLGHKDESVHRGYIASSDEHLQEARRMLNERLGPQSTPAKLLKIVDGE